MWDPGPGTRPRNKAFVILLRTNSCHIYSIFRHKSFIFCPTEILESWPQDTKESYFFFLSFFLALVVLLALLTVCPVHIVSRRGEVSNGKWTFLRAPGVFQAQAHQWDKWLSNPFVVCLLSFPLWNILSDSIRYEVMFPVFKMFEI